jgi:hypothetical protein
MAACDALLGGVEIWKLVARLRLLPKVTPEQYGQMERDCAEARQPDR